MDIYELGWLRDGSYRLEILRILSKHHFLLPSDIAKQLNLHRSSVSRILKDLKEKEFIENIKGESRTISYFLTEKGLQAIDWFDKNDKR